MKRSVIICQTTGCAAIAAAIASGALGCSGVGVDDELTLATVEGHLHSYSSLQPLSPTVCWVKDPESTSTDAEFDAKTQEFESIMSEWELRSGLVFDWQGRCSSPTLVIDPNTNEMYDLYPEDIRILWNELGREEEYQIPGRGCPHDNNNGNWGAFPHQKNSFRFCRHNASFGKNIGRNNVLHESGHTLGMIHEQLRTDRECGSGTPDDETLLTDYDLLSVMHYTYGSCGAPGNLGDTGLSPLDHLGVQIAYPASSAVKVSHGGLSFAGGWAVRTNATFQPQWYAMGAHSTVFDDLTWKVGGTLKSTNIAVTTGTLALPNDASAIVELAFDDPWDRAKLGQVTVTLSDAKHAAVVLAAL